MAAELVDGSGDGVWLVELATVTDPEIVASTINETLGMTTQVGRSPLETLLDALAHQRSLIVLDNCEHLIGACAKIADVILRRCSTVHLVATSREPLGIGSQAGAVRPYFEDSDGLFKNLTTARLVMWEGEGHLLAFSHLAEMLQDLLTHST